MSPRHSPHTNAAKTTAPAFQSMNSMFVMGRSWLPAEVIHEPGSYA